MNISHNIDVKSLKSIFEVLLLETNFTYTLI